MGKRSRRTKVGRNDPCPCGSGKKFKRCHGSLAGAGDSSASRNGGFARTVERLKAQEAQRQRQQGFGKPIISTSFQGYRIVAVGATVRYSKNWKTFHDFLLDSIKQELGLEWGNKELQKPFDERHPILQWYDHVCRYQQETIKTPGKVVSAPMTGAVAAYLGLAYNLYLLAHNYTIQQRLIKRLRDPAQFPGAYYETFVAAALIKAGFSLEFEDEGDPRSTHCEFIATHPITGSKFSVEAKARLEGKDHSDVGNQLYKALRKQANHQRLVFIDVNVPDYASEPEEIQALRGALDSVRSREDSITINGSVAPPAYLILTNHPYRYDLVGTKFRCSALAEGFKIPDFRVDSEFSSVRAALQSRERHREMFDLMESMRVHYEIPSTFEGEIPELHFHETEASQLVIGGRYFVPFSGESVPATLEEATVNEAEGKVYGIYRIDSGESAILSCPLTADELSAYQRHPDTFFGIYRRAPRRTSGIFELYDFFFNAHKNTPKSQLLKQLANHPRLGQLEDCTHEELLRLYCEGLTESVLSMGSG